MRSLAGQLNGFIGVPQPVAGLTYDDGVIVQGALANTVSTRKPVQLRTAATNEWVVPRSMPTAMRRWCGLGD